MIFLLLLGMEGCSKSSSPPGKVKTQSLAATIPGFQPSLGLDSVSSVENILEKNIFNLPDERNGNKINEPAKETTEPPKPQEVEITGIVKTGGLFKVSIENHETNESRFIIKHDQVGNYVLGNINWTEISAIDTSANETRVFMIGDRIPLPGTVTGESTPVPQVNAKSSDASATDTGNSSRRRFRRSRQTTTNDSSLDSSSGSSASDLEEKLRQRRKMQEEEQ
jgi:hypothetical protein